jgi:hypothetical protein
MFHGDPQAMLGGDVLFMGGFRGKSEESRLPFVERIPQEVGNFHEWVMVGNGEDGRAVADLVEASAE